MILHFLRHGSFSHEFTNARDDQGQLVHRCVLCGLDVPVLASAVIKGPKAVPDPVAGQPKTRVLRPATVARFERKGAR